MTPPDDTEVRRLRERVARMEAAIRWACGEKPDHEGRWFDPDEFGHTASIPRFWWRSILRKLSSIDAPHPALPPSEKERG